MVEKTKFISIFFMAVTLFLTGCAGIGPGTVARDRFDDCFFSTQEALGNG